MIYDLILSYLISSIRTMNKVHWYSRHRAPISIQSYSERDLGLTFCLLLTWELIVVRVDRVKMLNPARPGLIKCKSSVTGISCTFHLPVCIINSYSFSLNWLIVKLLLFILFSNVFVFQYMTTLYALLVLLVAMLVTTITSLYDLTIFTRQVHKSSHSDCLTACQLRNWWHLHWLVWTSAHVQLHWLAGPRGWLYNKCQLYGCHYPPEHYSTRLLLVSFCQK